jgi:predicted restriction endonuclease
MHWIHGGSTDLENLILLCHRHHWMVHEGNWQIVRTDNGRVLTVPPLVTFGPSSRGPD